MWGLGALFVDLGLLHDPCSVGAYRDADGRKRDGITWCFVWGCGGLYFELLKLLMVH
jgi:hypothetical protein